MVDSSALSSAAHLAASLDARTREQLEQAVPTAWLNPHEGSALEGLPLTASDLEESLARWRRFAPLLAHLFPSEASDGRIASELLPLPVPYRASLGLPEEVRSFIKADCNLPVCASVKARGGLYEVFSRAEEVGFALGVLDKGDNYIAMTRPPLAEELAKQEVAVGSTGNLGMSVGLSAAALGMKATVHMSHDAKDWKKNLLRSRGTTVVEHSGSYGEAVKQGRVVAAEDSKCHFIDDETSETLFLGYAAAAFELRDQLTELGISVSADNPLVVHIPCGVGGAPGGICWGLKHCFGEAVKVFFAEPTHAPCVTLGLATGRHDAVSVYDFGLDGRTEADGLAVQRASGFVCKMVAGLVAGTFTVDDDELFLHLTALLDAGLPFIEPSCCAALLGPKRLKGTSCQQLLQHGTHVFWATGGALVPQSERQLYIDKGLRLRQEHH